MTEEKNELPDGVRVDALGREVEYNDETGEYEPVNEDEESEVAPEAPQEPVRNEEVKSGDEASVVPAPSAPKAGA